MNPSSFREEILRFGSKAASAQNDIGMATAPPPARDSLGRITMRPYHIAMR
jgi:hypothetical protein